MLSNPNVVVFEVRELGDEAITFAFLRGRGLGQRYAGREPFGLTGPFMLPNGELLTRAAYAALKGLEDTDATERLDVILVEPGVKDLMLAFSDHALGLIQTTSVGANYPQLSEAEDELVFPIDTATHSSIAILRPDDTLSAVSLGIPDVEDRGKFGLVVGSLQVVALTPIPEGTFQVPAGTFAAARSAAGEIGIEHPAQWLEDLHEVFWTHCAPTQSDPLMRKRSFGIQDPAFEAEIACGNGDENQMLQLIDWVLDLNEDRERRRASRAKARFKMNRYSEVILRATHQGEREVVPVAFATRHCSKSAERLIQEILNWSWPRGNAIAGYRTNRASSAKPGGAGRRYLSRGAEPSAHELMAAHAGLSDFLKMRRFSDAEIDAMLNIEI